MNRRNATSRAEATNDADQRGVARVEEIDWSHWRLCHLSDSARLVYACLVDGLSSAAQDTIDSIDRVWRARHCVAPHRSEALRETVIEICLAVEELVDAGLLVLRDHRTIRTGWVVRPWESSPS